MIYSEMTDLEINKAVASACLDEWYDNGICVVRCDDEDRNIFNPCNSWADAGPIIHKYGIAIAFDEFEQEWVAFSEFLFDKCGWDMDVEPKKYHHHKEPLRAAMIVFLMMQEMPDAA